MRRFGDEIALFVVALVLRATYFAFHTSSIYFNQPILDSLWIHQWAASLAIGAGTEPEAYFRAPLYPYVVSVIYRVAGPNPWVIAILQHILGAGAVVLLYRLGRRLVGRVVGLVAGLLFAFYWVAIFLEGELLIVTMATFLGLAFLVTLSTASDKQDGWGRGFGLLGSGLLLGLAAIGRPNFLILMPLAIAWPLLSRWWLEDSEASGGRGSQAQAVGGGERDVGTSAPASVLSAVTRDTLPILFGIMLPVLGVTARNIIIADDRVLIASQGGLNLYVGNGPGADGKTAAAPGAVAPLRRDVAASRYRDNITLAGRQIAEAALGRPAKGSEVSRYWMQRTWDYVIESPDQAMMGFVKKLYYLINTFEISDNKDLREIQENAVLRWLAVVRLSWIVPFAWLGLWIVLVTNKKGYLIVLYLLLYSFSILLFFINVRMRFPLAPGVFLLAGVGIVTLAGRIRLARKAGTGAVWRPENSSRWLQGGILVGVFVLGVAISSSRLLAVDERKSLPGYRLNRATLLVEGGDCVGAMAAYEEALALDPDMLEAAFGRARAYERCQEPLAAISAYLDISARWPTFPQSHLARARVLASLGDTTAADQAYRSGIEVDPGLADAHLIYANFLARGGRHDAAALEFEEGLRLDPMQLRAWMNYGYTLAALGRLEAAIVAWERVLTLAPENVMAHTNIRRAREILTP
jgi:tetratricopeptide (TPR) repeat protein